MRTRTKIIACLLLLALVIGFPVVAHYHLKNQVAKYRRQLVAQGEKMTVAELTPVLPQDSENGANGLVSAAQQAGSINYTNQPPAMRVVVPGRAMVAWRQQVLPNSDSTNVWPGLRRDVEANKDALADMRAAAEQPALVFNLDYSQGFYLLLPHLAECKRAVQWLSAATVLDLHEGQVTNAVANLQAMTALVCHYQNEPLMISSLVRIAIASITVNTIWETLQSPGLNDGQLAALQADWEAADFFSQTEASFSMERAMFKQTFAVMRGSRTAATAMMSPSGGSGSSSALTELMELGQGVLNNPRQGLKELFRSYPGYWAWVWWWSYEDELAQLQYVQADLRAVRQAKTEHCFGPALSQCEQANQAIRKAHPRAGNWIGFDPSPAYQTYITRLRVVEMQRHLLVTAIALKRFQLGHGHFPETLAVLVPEFCRETPRDPVDGQPLRYHLQAGGTFLLYSIGENGVDDGGDPSPANDSTSTRSWFKGRDMVWPQPASPQESLLYQLEVDGERDRQRIRARIVVTNDMPAAVRVRLEHLARTYHFTLTNSPEAR